MEYTLQELQQQAVEVTKVVSETKLSKVGEIGIGVDFSKNRPANPMQDNFPLLDWLMRTELSSMMRRDQNAGARMFKENGTGRQMYLLPHTWATNPPIDTTGECCWLPLDLSKCSDAFPLNLLCLRDSEKILDSLINQQKKAQGIDLITPFQRRGESIAKARERMAKTSMAFFSAKNIIAGTTDTDTGIIKPFHGLQQVMEDSAVFSVLGENVQVAFDILACRLSVMPQGNFIFALHPLTYRALKETIVPNRLGQYPNGWESVNGALRFMGYSFIVTNEMNVDTENGTGEIWMIDGRTVGTIMGTNLIVNDKNFIRESYATGSRSEGCAVDATYYYNFGGVGSLDSNRLAIITDVPLSNACLGSTLNGLGGLIQPNTLVPR